MNSVIVLGAASMLGREVNRQLADAGITVIRAGQKPENDINVDLGSDVPLKFRQPYRADVMIHLAAAFGDDSPSGIKENFHVNINGCNEALEIARQTGVKVIVYAGSVFSIPNLESGPLRSYGFSKMEAERILEWGIARTSGQFCSLRLPMLWDTEGDCCRQQPWFGRIVAYASRGLTLRLPISNGPRNFMHVSDAVQLLIRAARYGLQGIYPACHPNDIDLHEFAKSAYKFFGRGGEAVIDESKTPFRKMEFPKDDSVFAALGYVLTVRLANGLELIRHAGTADRFGPLDVT